jgi:S-formylglutathione hydrolase FrmB
MGGFGALNLGMRHPDVFGAVYATAPGLLDDGGVAEAASSTRRTRSAPPWTSWSARRRWRVPTSRESRVRTPIGSTSPTGWPSPRPTEPPYLAYPFTKAGGAGTRDEDVWAAWDAGFGDWDLKVAEFGDDLASLSGIGFDCAGDDSFAWDPRGLRVPRRPAHRGGNRPPVHPSRPGATTDASGTRLIDGMLPFMAANLATE